MIFSIRFSNVKLVNGIFSKAVTLHLRNIGYDLMGRTLVNGKFFHQRQCVRNILFFSFSDSNFHNSDKNNVLSKVRNADMPACP
jgi:hypothetical protein